MSERKKVQQYLNGFELKASRSYLYFNELFKVKKKHVLIVNLIFLYMESRVHIIPETEKFLKRIHMRNLKCCYKLVDSVWDDFKIFLGQNIVFETR